MWITPVPGPYLVPVKASATTQEKKNTLEEYNFHHMILTSSIIIVHVIRVKSPG